MNIAQLATLLALAATRKSTFGFSMEAVTRARLSKSATERIFGDRDAEVTKHVKIVNAFLGRNYEKNVQAHSLRDGGNGEFRAMKPKGMHWVPGLRDFVLESDADSRKWYLRIGISPSATKTEVRYFVDGRPATTGEAMEIADALPVPNYNRQHEAGVAAGDEVVVRNYAVENIVAATAWGIVL